MYSDSADPNPERSLDGLAADLLIAYLILGTIVEILLIGKPSQPVKPSDAVITLISTISLIALIITI